MKQEDIMGKHEWLTAEERTLIHKKSLELLIEIGVKVESEKILKSMAKAGFAVEPDRSLLHFTDQQIEDALRAAPKRFTLGGLNKKYDMKLGEGHCYFATDGQGCYAADLDSEERKESKMADLLDAAVLADQLDYLHCFWPIVTAHDVPNGTRTLHELVECWRVSSKHFQSDCYNEGQAKYYQEILLAVFGSIEEIKARNPFSLVGCPVTPLTFEGPMLEGTVALGELGVPVVILPMPISGTTAPMSMMATVIQNNAEVMAGNVIFQTLHPGRPVIYGAAPGILDMSTGLFCVGSPEGGLQNAACCEMAHFYNFPVLACGGGADAQVPGIQSAMERMAGILPIYQAGADIICGLGLTGTAQCLYREELLIGQDIVGFCKRIGDGLRIGEEHALTGLAKEIGPGGNFLAEASTVKYLRAGEHYLPQMLCREGYESWKHSPKKDIRAYSKDKVRDMLAKPRKNNFDTALTAKLKEIMAKADKEIGAGE